MPTTLQQTQTQTNNMTGPIITEVDDDNSSSQIDAVLDNKDNLQNCDALPSSSNSKFQLALNQLNKGIDQLGNMVDNVSIDVESCLNNSCQNMEGYTSNTECAQRQYSSEDIALNYGSQSVSYQSKYDNSQIHQDHSKLNFKQVQNNENLNLNVGSYIETNEKFTRTDCAAMADYEVDTIDGSETTKAKSAVLSSCLNNKQTKKMDFNLRAAATVEEGDTKSALLLDLSTNEHGLNQFLHNMVGSENAVVYRRSQTSIITRRDDDKIKAIKFASRDPNTNNKNFQKRQDDLIRSRGRNRQTNKPEYSFTHAIEKTPQSRIDIVGYDTSTFHDDIRKQVLESAAEQNIEMLPQLAGIKALPIQGPKNN